MAWYRRGGKLGLHAFHFFTSKNATFHLSSRIYPTGYMNWGSKAANFGGFSSFSSISQGIIGLQRTSGTKKPRPVLAYIGVGMIVISSGYWISKLETVPYTNRIRFVSVPAEGERILGEYQFKEKKESYEGKILAGTHPESVRVRRIAKGIIDAMQRGFGKEKVWIDLKDATPEHAVLVEADNENKNVIRGYKWVQPKSSKKWWLRPATSHLDRLDWEVLVVNDPSVHVFTVFGGKIFISTGLLECFGSDAEIAVSLGHEVAHVVARHLAEVVTKNSTLIILMEILSQFAKQDTISRISSFISKRSRRFEEEADYIGLLLCASAGYDPRLVPAVYKKLGKHQKESAGLHVDSDDPRLSGECRAQVLAKTKIMEEALAIYRDVRARCGDEFFNKSAQPPP